MLRQDKILEILRRSAHPVKRATRIVVLDMGDGTWGIQIRGKLVTAFNGTKEQAVQDAHRRGKATGKEYEVVTYE